MEIFARKEDLVRSLSSDEYVNFCDMWVTNVLMPYVHKSQCADVWLRLTQQQINIVAEMFLNANSVALTDAPIAGVLARIYWKSNRSTENWEKYCQLVKRQDNFNVR